MAYNGVQILSAQTTTANSTAFKISQKEFKKSSNDRPLLGIYGTYGTSTNILEYKAPDGNWYTVNGISITGLGLYELPVNSEVELQLAHTAGGSSSLSAFVFNGEVA